MKSPKIPPSTSDSEVDFLAFLTAEASGSFKPNKGTTGFTLLKYWVCMSVSSIEVYNYFML